MGRRKTALPAPSPSARANSRRRSCRLAAVAERWRAAVQSTVLLRSLWESIWVTGGHLRASATSKVITKDSIGSSENALAADLCFDNTDEAMVQCGHQTAGR